MDKNQEWKCRECGAVGTLDDPLFDAEHTYMSTKSRPDYTVWHEPCVDGDFDGDSWVGYGQCDEADQVD